MDDHIRWAVGVVVGFVVAALAGLAVALLVAGGDLHVARGQWGVLGRWLVGAAVSVTVLVWAFRAVDERDGARWLEARGVAPDSQAVQLVVRFVGATRSARALGAVVGFQIVEVPSLFVNVLDTDSAAYERMVAYTGSLWLPLTILAGYAGGAVLAEMAVGSPSRSGAVRKASLRPRHADVYVSWAARWGPRIVAGVLVAWALAAIAPFVGVRPPIRHAVFAVCVAAFVEGLHWYVISRPQHLDDPTLIAADDTARSSTAHAVAGAGLALQLLAVGQALPLLAPVVHPVSGLMLRIVAGSMWVAALAVWLGLGTSFVWRARRDTDEKMPA